MVASTLRPALEAFGERLRGVFGERLRELRLFGSHARGEANEDSDVDVLVLIDGLTDLEVGVVAGEAAPIILATGKPLSPLPMATAHLDEMRRQGRTLAAELDRDGERL